MPYRRELPVAEQILVSVESSLRNLRVEDDPSSSESAYIDCLVLHSPLRDDAENRLAWNAMQTYLPDRVRRLGVSNVSVKDLVEFWAMGPARPAVVQNRWHEGNTWDREVRAFCRENDIVYQSFWTLTGNPTLLRSEPVTRLSKEAGVSVQVALYSLVMELGIVPLNGTTSSERMDEDLKEVANVRNWTLVYAEKWESIVKELKAIVDGPQ
jgi:diketogulonate reductase-like aldo/keto reductase